MLRRRIVRLKRCGRTSSLSPRSNGRNPNRAAHGPVRSELALAFMGYTAPIFSLLTLLTTTILY